MEEKILRGRKKIIAVISMFIIMQFFIFFGDFIIYRTVYGPPPTILPRIIRFLVLAIFPSIFLYLGHNWAKWLTLFLCGIMTFLLFYYVSPSLLARLWLTGISNLLGVILGLLCIVFLIFSSDVGAYFGRRK